MIRLFTNLKIALGNLRATRVRTALTVIGVVIGVTSVTTILALAEGAKNVVRGQVDELGNNLLTVRPGKATRDNFGKAIDYNYLAAFGASTITERDLNTIRQTEGIASAAPFMLVTGSVQSGDRLANGSIIIGTNPEGDETLQLTLKSGEFVSDATSSDTVVLGRDLALELFGSDMAVGQKITLRGQEFTVIGILDYFRPWTVVSTVFDLNHAALINLPSAKSFNQGIAQIQQINIRAVEPNNTQLADNLQQKLLANHGGENDIAVLKPQETLQLTDNIFLMLTSAISAIASISILVGGVGIMNIMLVSVTERTREIGIRKAVGATNSQILWQFMIEALMMSLVGGVVGIIVGYVLAYAVSTFLGFLPGISWQILGTSLGVSLAVGLIFGLWPAVKAARKDPIEALRYFQ